MNARQEINRQILELLLEINDKVGDQRFGQLLVNCEVALTEKRPDDRVVNIVHYNEESSKILARVVDSFRRMGI